MEIFACRYLKLAAWQLSFITKLRACKWMPQSSTIPVKARKNPEKVVELELFVNTYCKEDLKRAVSHFYVLILKETPRDSDITMILWCPVRCWGYRGHGAARPILHPPRTVHWDVKGQNEICFLQKSKRTINVRGWYSGIQCLSRRFHMHKEAKSCNKTALSHES